MSTHLRTEIDRRLSRTFRGSELLESMGAYHLEGGGKRFRACLALIHGRNRSVAPDDAMTWGLACEILHNATLVHDDIQDQDPLRRGQASVWQRFGAPQAINVGDFFILKAFETLSRLGDTACIPPLLDCLTRKAQDVVRGQALELQINDLEIAEIADFWRFYLKMVELKTGALLQAPVEGIELLCRQTRAHAARVSQPWSTFGIAYQINDDINDFLGRKQQQQKLKDFAEQKVNSLIARLSQKPRCRSLIRQYLTCDKGSEEHMEVIHTLCIRIQGEGVIEDLREQKAKLIDQLKGDRDCEYFSLFEDFLETRQAVERLDTAAVY